MIHLAEGVSNQILLLAPNLLGESLAMQLANAEPDLHIALRREELTRKPCLVIWSIESIEVATAIQIELSRLQEYWKPSPVLLLLPAKLQLNTDECLQFDAPGLLQDPNLETLQEAIKTIRGGGRVVRLKDQNASSSIKSNSTMGLGQWLLLSGVQQINADLSKLNSQQDQSNNNGLNSLIRQGRIRELNASKKFLYLLWGPIRLTIDSLESQKSDKLPPNSLVGGKGYPLEQSFGTSISLKNRDQLTVWNTINTRLNDAFKGSLVNSTGTRLAIEALTPSRQSSLLIALLNQLDEVINRLIKPKDSNILYKEEWLQLQSELKKQALRSMAGTYVRIPHKGKLTPVSDHLLNIIDFSDTDNELPEVGIMLDPLLLNKPVIVQGQLLPSDDPRALIQLEMYITNWVIRTAELISAEILEASGDWPELRQYLLNQKLISTRELERLRNEINSQIRWEQLIKRPIQIYESKRLFYQISKSNLIPVLITEPRDEELLQLGWIQQQVALLVEIRDAIAPQLQTLVRKVGDLMVIVLTQVIGRAIGLIGRGIAQGMGRSLSRN